MDLKQISKLIFFFSLNNISEVCANDEIAKKNVKNTRCMLPIVKLQ
jgi:hypothetical protein